MRALIPLLLVASALAVEVGPLTVANVHDGDTIAVCDGDPSAEGAHCDKVRLLYVDTPELNSNKHGEAMPEGKKATEFVKGLLPVGTKVYLWSPRKELERDRYGRFLAMVCLKAPSTLKREEEAAASINVLIVKAGWSPYWRKYASAPGAIGGWGEWLDAAQDEAETKALGAWATAPKYMRDKANERTAPRGEK